MLSPIPHGVKKKKHPSRLSPRNIYSDDKHQKEENVRRSKIDERASLGELFHRGRRNRATAACSWQATEHPGFFDKILAGKANHVNCAFSQLLMYLKISHGKSRRALQLKSGASQSAVFSATMYGWISFTELVGGSVHLWPTRTSIT